MRSRVFALLGSFAFAGVLSAASTGQSSLHMPQGTAAGTANGDYVSDAGALNTDYFYYIEVPPSTTRLQVEIFDADIGRGGAGEDDANRDRDRGGGYGSQVDYTLFRPDGSQAATLNDCDDNTCNDNAWTVLLNSNTAQNTAAGHWQLRVSMHNGGNDINAFGLRAYETSTGTGDKELNIYAESMVSMGTNPNNGANSTRTYTLYPYVTSGCTCSENDFDVDTNNGNSGSVVYTRPSTGTQSFASTALSVDNTWNHDDLTSWVTNDTVNDYGVWTVAPTINTYNNGAVNGNYETFYVGSYLNSGNPTANPFTGTFRLYLPTDAGVAPVKPYLEQYLTYNRNFTGPNPPQVGLQTTFTVTVRLVNPTPYAITFSAANLVTTQVPGGQVLYGGNGSVSQGTITAQPAVGGSGTITWNPGTVNAGVNPILSYDVRVIPTGAGRIPVTATPASGNGTRARFVDETGNTTQTRATYTLGGLCELAVATTSATPVLVSSFDLDVRGGATQIDFATSSEASTIGFNVYRADGSKVNEHLIPSSLRPQGSKYHLLDPQNSDPNARYTIEEVTATGAKMRYGPYNRLKGFDREEAKQRNASRFRGVSQSLGSADVASDANQKVAAAMVGVSANGIVRVPAQTLADTLGANVNAIRASLGNGKLAVTSNYAPISWTTDGENLLYYGQKGTTIYSDERVYRVEQTSGAQMQTLNVNAPGAALSTYTAAKAYAKDVFPATVLPLDVNSDYWFWDYVISGDPDVGRRTFTIDVPSMASASGAQLAVKLQGAFQDGAHKAQISLNGVPVGEANWTSLNSSTTVINLPAAVLRDGANEVTIEGILAPSAYMDIFYIDGFGLKYQRYARPEGGVLEARTSGAFGAGPFTAAPMILDISDPQRPVVVKGARFASNLAQLTVPSTKTLFLAESFLAPSSVRPAYEAKLTNKLRADWVAIAPHNMVAATAPLATMRQRDGLTPLVVDLDDVYNEFSGGNSTPLAIRDFIKSTRTWSRAPKYFVLVGIGNVDYRGVDIPPGPMPPLMTTTQDGIFASDSLFADFNGDRLPDVAIGRIPVASASELSAYIAKLDANTRRSVASAPIVFTADNSDGTSNFRGASETASIPLAERPSEKIYLDDLGAGPARTAMFGAWSNGTPLVSWVGHGGVDQLSNTAVLTAYDSADLVSSGRLPIFVAMTCTINRFETGYVDAMGTTLTREPNAGALAVWSASGLSQHPLAADIQRSFMQLAQQAPAGTRLGDLIVQALGKHPSDTTSIYLLLGDPALRLDLPSEVTNGGVPSAPGE
jgi:hypothetical protein